MGEILSYIDKLMRDQGQPKYTLRPHLVEVSNLSTENLNGGDDLYVMVSAFMKTSTALDGEIFGANNALSLKPVTIATVFYAHQVFTGHIEVRNLVDDVLYVEFIIISPEKN